MLGEYYKDESLVRWFASKGSLGKISCDLIIEHTFVPYNP